MGVQLEEHCGNCDNLVWHDMRIQYDGDGVHRLAAIPNPTTGSCTHPLMKRQPSGYKLVEHECLFWKAVAI